MLKYAVYGGLAYLVYLLLDKTNDPTVEADENVDLGDVGAGIGGVLAGALFGGVLPEDTTSPALKSAASSSSKSPAPTVVAKGPKPGAPSATDPAWGFSSAYGYSPATGKPLDRPTDGPLSEGLLSDLP